MFYGVSFIVIFERLSLLFLKDCPFYFHYPELLTIFIQKQNQRSRISTVFEELSPTSKFAELSPIHEIQPVLYLGILHINKC